MFLVDVISGIYMRFESRTRGLYRGRSNIKHEKIIINLPLISKLAMVEQGSYEFTSAGNSARCKSRRGKLKCCPHLRRGRTAPAIPAVFMALLDENYS